MTQELPEPTGEDNRETADEEELEGEEEQPLERCQRMRHDV